jgi:pimeloyl-ACP methyl ester carboxylesterase
VTHPQEPGWAGPQPDTHIPPEAQLELAAGLPNARLRIIERAGHNPQSEQTAEVMQAIRDFIPADPEAA